VKQTRRLAAILAADVAGYSRLTGADEYGTLQGFKAIKAELVDPKVAEHNGRLVKTTGDSLLIEFSSAVDALRCATELQAGMVERNSRIAIDRHIEFQIGINVGDVVVEMGGAMAIVTASVSRLAPSIAAPGGHVDRLGTARVSRLARRKRTKTPARIEIGSRPERRVRPLAPRILHLNGVRRGYGRARFVGQVGAREPRGAEIGKR
jgi:Adenylate and Guanylate cyclase catalytic domain